MQDAAALEKRGVASTVLVTKPFDTQARSMVTLLGLDEYEYAVIGHPMGSLTEEEILARAREALPQVIAQIGG